MSVSIVGLIYLPVLLLFLWALWFRIPGTVEVPYHWGPSGKPTNWAPAGIVFPIYACASLACASTATIAFFAAQRAGERFWTSGLTEIGCVVSGVLFPAWVVSAAGTTTDIALVWILLLITIGGLYGHGTARLALRSLAALSNNSAN